MDDSAADDTGDDDTAVEACPAEATVDAAVCALDAGPFSLTIDNPFYPLEVGDVLVLEGEEDGAELMVEITVLDETEEVAGVTTRVVEERETEDGELTEISRNFFAQAPDGTLCYFGEDVDVYEDGEVVSNEGAWRAGNGNSPGVFMPAAPAVGDVFQREGAPGIAEDIATITAVGEEVTVPAGVFDDTISVEECNPLEEGATDEKVFARGVGLIVDEEVELTSQPVGG